MRRTTVVLTGAAALVAAMLGRMGFVDWSAVIHVTVYVGVAAVLVLSGIAVVIGLPALLLIGLVYGVISLFKPGPYEDAA